MAAAAAAAAAALADALGMPRAFVKHAFSSCAGFPHHVHVTAVLALGQFSLVWSASPHLRHLPASEGGMLRGFFLWP